MEVRQLFDKGSGTYTYFLIDNAEVMIVDSVKNNVERDVTLIDELGLKVLYVLDTHIHADHITGAFDLKKRTGAKIVLGIGNKGVKNVDVFLQDGEELPLGSSKIKAILTPGHTAGCTTYHVENCIFTGDTLLIRSVGRTDFQEGDAHKLFQSIQKLYALDEETRVYPAHNYAGIPYSTLREEKKYNAFVTQETTEEEFVDRVRKRKLPLPKLIDVAVPANMTSGEKG